MKHKHYDMIVAWAEGKQIQMMYDGNWSDYPIDCEPAWREEASYRIKPEQEPIGQFVGGIPEVSQQREWVGLTDDEIKNILDCGRGEFIAIQKAQQLLKDKNTTN
jgi:hypothetical protein